MLYFCTRKIRIIESLNLIAALAELVDAPDLGSGNESCVGSSPICRTGYENSIFVDHLSSDNRIV